MPEKDGDEGKSTKSVVNKKQKQMMGEEGYDIARDMGRVRPSKDKKDATTMPPSKEMKKTQKVNKGPSALDIVKKKYKGQIMNVEELDLTKVAEAFGGYIVEAPVDDREEKKNRAAKRLAKAAGINIRTQGPEQAAATDAFADMRMSDDEKFSKVTSDVKKGMRATAAGKGRAEPKKRATRANYPKTRAELEAKRKEYEIDRQGKATDAGIEKFARRRKQSNLPLSKDDLDSAKKAMVGTGEKGTDVGKYGGRLSRRRNKNAKTYDEIKKEIDSKEKEKKKTPFEKGQKTFDQMFGKNSKVRQMQQGEKPDFPDPFEKKKEQKKPESFIGDVPPDREQQKPPNRGPNLPGQGPGEKPIDLNKGYREKRGAIEKAKEFARKNPVGGYAAVELGKGIIGKLMKVKGAVPGVVGGTVGRRSARGGGGL